MTEGIIQKVFLEFNNKCEFQNEADLLQDYRDRLIAEIKKEADVYISDATPAGEHDAISLEELIGNNE